MNRGPAKRARAEQAQAAAAANPAPAATPKPKIDGLSTRACDFLRGLLTNPQFGIVAKDAAAVVELQAKLGIEVPPED